jgi:hypothetical protein
MRLAFRFLRTNQPVSILLAHGENSLFLHLPSLILSTGQEHTYPRRIGVAKSHAAKEAAHS